MPDLLALLKGVKNAVDTLTAIRDKVQDADARDAIADLKMSMADLKEAIVELREDNTQLRDEVKRLSEPPDLTKHREAYIRRDDNGAIAEGPFCPRCYEVDGKAITLTTLGKKMAGMTHLCPQCKSPHNVHPSAKPSAGEPPL